MFGYVVVNKPELKFREYDQYRSYYCGLCRSLKENYGLAAEVTLTYDMTFLILLLSGLYEPEEQINYRRCEIHPLKRHEIRRNKYSDYAADMSVILAYYSLMDDWEDEHKLRAKAHASLLKNSFEKVCAKYPEKSGIIRECLDNLHEYEKNESDNLDEVSGTFGRLMACIFTPEEDFWNKRLRRMAFFLGKYIYLLDAFDDLKQDIKDNRYNPLIKTYNSISSSTEEGETAFREYCRQLLTMMISESCVSFEELPIITNAEIIRNILYAGIWTGFDKACQNNNNKESKQ